MKGSRFLSFSISAALVACGQPIADSSNPALPIVIAGASPQSTAIQHVVIIVQENRSPDNLFNGLPGADTVRAGRDSHGRSVPLQRESFAAPYDISHTHGAYLTEYSDGQLDGFNLVGSHCRKRPKCPMRGHRPYAFVPRSETKPYFKMATQYTFGDRMFQTNQGPSFPAHQYLLSGTSTTSDRSPLRAAENAYTRNGNFTGGCDSPAGSSVLLIDEQGHERQQMYPCFERLSLTDLLETKGLRWAYYQTHPKSGLWDAPAAIRHIERSPEYRLHVITPPAKVLSDISHGSLANVTWITPTAAASDHAGNTDGSGPSWVASIVNAIGKSSYWKSTAIFVTWDDWGGWYDHVIPQQYNAYELGFRVPLIVISPYAKRGYVSHRQHEFGSILKFIEKTFGLGTLGTTDVRSDDLSDCFDFGQLPRRFTPIAAPLGAQYFLRQAYSGQNPDDE